MLTELEHMARFPQSLYEPWIWNSEEFSASTSLTEIGPNGIAECVMKLYSCIDIHYESPETQETTKQRSLSKSQYYIGFANIKISTNTRARYVNNWNASMHSAAAAALAKHFALINRSTFLVKQVVLHLKTDLASDNVNFTYRSTF